jgi:hypothetical protein
MCWGIAALVLLANWRSIAAWLSGASRGLGSIFQQGFLSFPDPVYRFAVLGLLMVLALAMWAVYWNSRSSNKQGPKGGQQ